MFARLPYHTQCRFCFLFPIYKDYVQQTAPNAAFTSNRVFLLTLRVKCSPFGSGSLLVIWGMQSEKQASGSRFRSRQKCSKQTADEPASPRVSQIPRSSFSDVLLFATIANLYLPLITKQVKKIVKEFIEAIRFY